MHDREVLSFLGHYAYIFHSLARQYEYFKDSWIQQVA
jgi:hypothetical protein